MKIKLTQFLVKWLFFFQELKFFSEILKTSKQYSCSEGEKEVNRKKNRYKDILPCKYLVLFE
jgi:tyrosine-protein phosphatase non-receptor type 12/18/22